MDGRASLSIAADTQDIDMMAARSAGIWIGLSLDDEALASIRRDGLDPAALRLSGLHPFEFEPGPDGGLNVIAHANDNEAAEALLDLFRVFFLRRLLAARFFHPSPPPREGRRAKTPDRRRRSRRPSVGPEAPA